MSQIQSFVNNVRKLIGENEGTSELLKDKSTDDLDEKELNRFYKMERVIQSFDEEELIMEELTIQKRLIYLGLAENGHIFKGILNHLREWRQNKDIRNHFSIVLAGSVGIHHIVKMIEGRTADINDFGVIDFEALTYDEAKDYLSWATKNATIQYNESLQTHLLSKISYFIPYFINLMLDEINKTARKIRNPNITTENIDKAFDKIVKNSDHFKEWKRRLFEYFPQDESDFLHEVLVYIAHKNQINKRQLYDLALKYNKKTTYMELIQGLEHDGYITELGENYIFISPFLKAFWKNDNPIYDGF